MTTCVGESALQWMKPGVGLPGTLEDVVGPANMCSIIDAMVKKCMSPPRGSEVIVNGLYNNKAVSLVAQVIINGQSKPVGVLWQMRTPSYTAGDLVGLVTPPNNTTI